MSRYDERVAALTVEFKCTFDEADFGHADQTGVHQILAGHAMIGQPVQMSLLDASRTVMKLEAENTELRGKLPGDTT